jgi:hypothetical protein
MASVTPLPLPTRAPRPFLVVVPSAIDDRAARAWEDCDFAMQLWREEKTERSAQVALAMMAHFLRVSGNVEALVWRALCDSMIAHWLTRHQLETIARVRLA